MTEPKGQTLAELDVQPGDVVKLADGDAFTIAENPRMVPNQVQIIVGGRRSWIDDRYTATIIFRADPTRAQLIAQRDALDAQIAAMPETVRVHWSMKTGFTNFCYGQSTHYRDFPIGPDGVPEGFEEVEK